MAFQEGIQGRTKQLKLANVPSEERGFPSEAWLEHFQCVAWWSCDWGSFDRMLFCKWQGRPGCHASLRISSVATCSRTTNFKACMVGLCLQPRDFRSNIRGVAWQRMVGCRCPCWLRTPAMARAFLQQTRSVGSLIHDS